MPRPSRSARLTLAPLEDRVTPIAGTMDASFGGGDGMVKFNLPGFFAVLPADVAVQADGKTVLAGVGDTPASGHGMVLRLNPDGSLDPSFGGGDGHVESQYGGQNAHFTRVALGPDGKAVATGAVRLSGKWVALTARFNTDGTPDLTFNGTGFAVADVTANEEGATGVAVQPDGKVLVGGNANGFAFVLRYTAAGALDPTFNLDGVYQTVGEFRGLALAADGKVLVGGTGNPGHGLMALRLTADGNPDPAFDGDGMAVATVPGTGSAEGYDVAALPDGRVVVVGTGEVSSMGQGVVARFLADGTPDTTFNGDGKFLLQFPPDSQGGEFKAVEVDSDGRIVVAGFSLFPHHGLLTRFTEAGDPDPAFGVGNSLIRPGVVRTNTGGGTEIYGLDVMADGRVVTTGRSDNNLLALRFLGNFGAAADQFPATEDIPLTVAAPGVLGNDVLPPGGNPQVVLVQGPAHAASFALNADGSFSYTPAANYTGPESFTYQVVDGTFTTNTVTVALPVQSVNDAPTSATDAYEYRFSSPLTVSAANGVLKNDLDVDGNTLTVVLVDPPAQGTVDLNSDGSFTFIYPNGLTEPVTFTYRATDGTATGPVTTVTLTRAPNALPVSGADAYSLPLFGPLTVSAADGVLKNDTDADGDALTAVLVTPPAVGLLTFQPNGSFTYAFPPQTVGSVTFTYAATDGTDQGAPATVTLTREPGVQVDSRQLFIFGTEGTDVIRVRPAGGRAMRVTMQTAAGLTSQVVSPGPKSFIQIIVALGPGNDRLDVDSGRVGTRAYGGTGDDVLATGPADDLIFGDADSPGPGGNDVIDAGGGFNQVGTGDGDDVVRTGAGPDIVVAGAGRNQIATGGGNDTVKAGAGGSFIDAGAGSDEVSVTGGSNWIEGGSGSDVLLGGTGADRIFGGVGQDLVSGGQGADLVEGGSGNDILFEGTVQTVTSTGPSLATLLSRYRSTHKAVLDSIRDKLFVVVDLASSDTLTGGAGTDWLWSRGAPDVLDLAAAEPSN